MGAVVKCFGGWVAKYFAGYVAKIISDGVAEKLGYVLFLGMACQNILGWPAKYFLDSGGKSFWGVAWQNSLDGEVAKM